MPIPSEITSQVGLLSNILTPAAHPHRQTTLGGILEVTISRKKVESYSLFPFVQKRALYGDVSIVPFNKTQSYPTYKFQSERLKILYED